MQTIVLPQLVVLLDLLLLGGHALLNGLAGDALQLPLLLLDQLVAHLHERVVLLVLPLVHAIPASRLR